jgi:hypothetical protein
MEVVEGIILAICLASLLAFLLYVASFRNLPTGYRPSTPTVDRFGRPLPPSENPGYRETEDESHII